MGGLISDPWGLILVSGGLESDPRGLKPDPMDLKSDPGGLKSGRTEIPILLNKLMGKSSELFTHCFMFFVDINHYYIAGGSTIHFAKYSQFLIIHQSLPLD